MLIHKCRRCGFQSQIFEKWVTHLWEQQHQTVSKSSFLKWSDEENQRSLVIYAPETPFPLPSEVLELFLSLDIMTVDFVCWTERPQNFVVQFELREHVERVLKIMREQPDKLTFKENTLGMRRKSDVADFEWPILIGHGTARDGSSENPVLIELSDDGSSNDEQPMETTNSENGHGSTCNGNSRSESMDTDDVPYSDRMNGDAETGEVELESMEGHVQIESKISDEFRSVFLEKIKQVNKSKDDKRKVKENLRQLQSFWLDMFVSFHNKLWPLCFVMSNKNMTTNRNEVGFEAKFTCECLHSKYNAWFSKDPEKDKIDAKIEDFFEIIKDDRASSQRLAKITESAKRKKRSVLKFKCHMLVSFSDSGLTFARFRFEHIKGIDPLKKMKIVQKVYKKLFSLYEEHQIKQWSPSVKKELKREKSENKEWTEIEVITVE